NGQVDRCRPRLLHKWGLLRLPALPLQAATVKNTEHHKLKHRRQCPIKLGTFALSAIAVFPKIDVGKTMGRLLPKSLRGPLRPGNSPPFEGACALRAAQAGRLFISSKGLLYERSNRN